MSANSPEIEGLIRELDGSLTAFEQLLNSINNFNHDDRERKLKKCQIYITSIRTTKDAVQLEARSLPPMALPNLQDSMRKRMARFKQCVDLYEHKKMEIDRDVLQADDTDYGVAGTVRNDVQQLAAQGDALQDQTDAAITNMAGLVTDAQEIAEQTDARLDAQTAQMQGIAVQLGNVQNNTKAAGKTVANIARGAASDLCIQILCGGIVVCTITIIILVSV
ncbi:putative transmembrane protein [Gregarina niphandrodes]|uniref:Transmembrane protein n=1 Tax=Gregarina niphandrodes TaxID=110365 RepID=A0A023BDB2_GRENI|nr:putative transmembrane protein [Gregarina niphandrodes]EZG88183.1 putative transmembrane protein [Gregarina niphandrodes]|eukprot:XP_011128607.1 putative transmembrane protein [Gregarina niphandrodes]